MNNEWQFFILGYFKIRRSIKINITIGLTKVIKALLKQSPFENSIIVASRSDQLVDDRKMGKLKMLEKAGYFPNPELDVVVSDSYRDDQDLLEFVNHSFYIKWD